MLGRESDIEVVAQAGSLAQARQMLHTPLDIAVVDLALPDGDGRDLIGELRQSNAGISVVVLSAAIAPVQLEEVVKAGADAVLHKIASPPDHRGGGEASGWPMSPKSTSGAGISSFQAPV